MVVVREDVARWSGDAATLYGAEVQQRCRPSLYVCGVSSLPAVCCTLNREPRDGRRAANCLRVSVITVHRPQHHPGCRQRRPPGTHTPSNVQRAHASCLV